MPSFIRSGWLSFLSEYGMLVVLFLLGVVFSIATWSEQRLTGSAAGAELAGIIAGHHKAGPAVLVVVVDTTEDRMLARSLEAELTKMSAAHLGTVVGSPPDAYRALEEIGRLQQHLNVIAASSTASSWAVFDRSLTELKDRYPSLRAAELVAPRSYHWPHFLTRSNLLNIADQIAVIAIIAIGMTMVIVAGGIDLSVGSLIALSAVTATLLIRELGGADQAGTPAMAACSAGAVLLCALVGIASGITIIFFRIPPFIATLSIMLIARGLAFLLTRGESVSQLPDSFTWLGRGKDLFGLPNAVVFMILLYTAAHVVMTRMTFGRYLYAIGGNPEAARLSGIRSSRIIPAVYGLCGALAGLGGIITASQLKSGAPQIGEMKELYVIAAVVVGGTSLSGGSGSILGTLIGAFIIAVIENGMNLVGLESYTQKVLLGLVILAAVLLDRARRRGSGKT